MQRKAFFRIVLAGALAVALPSRANDGVVVIAHSPMKLDAEGVRRVFTGRLIELDGQPVRPVNLAPGEPVRRRFLAGVVQQSEEDYLAYWTVRRYIGKGVPPRDLATQAEVIDYVLRTPGGIGYIDAAALRPGLNVVLRP